MLDQFLYQRRVAYFSMEIALRSEIPTYAGGLGILAGDTLRSAADLSLPLVAVSLVSRNGYFRQHIDDAGRQVEQPAPWVPQQWATQLDARVALHIGGRRVALCAWLYVLDSHMGGKAPVILLDTDVEENHPDDRRITEQLYGGDDAYRLRQEMVLGMGGVRMLHALGFDIDTYHMNEGHAALLCLELLRRHAYDERILRPGEPRYDLPEVRALCCFTTHTPVEAGHDRFPYPLVDQLFDQGSADEDGLIDPATLRMLAGADALNMTRLALNLSEFVNGVGSRHAELSARMFPGYRIRGIANGVHPHTWTADAFHLVYDHYVPGWCHEPELLNRADAIPDLALVEAHAQARQALLDRVRAGTGQALDPHAAILGFARRMTAYKRPDLLFTDLGRLRQIHARHPFQIVLAGKAHPRDMQGKELIEQLIRHARELADTLQVVFLPDYDMATARLLVGGCDVWLNTPLPPLEASGTSGMKAAFNGVPSLSVLDGWWTEGCVEGVTGWAIDDAASLYARLEDTVLPLYYAGPAPGASPGWTALMKGAIVKNAALFNSHRMMRRYATEAYLR
ncbi:MAG TPA: alpha-glucan family phosphorylase [Steroidobacteraceae bacterium]|nr:alpha-glucan family phosphorylase [Steroidobacteraceae bacterium]